MSITFEAVTLAGEPIGRPEDCVDTSGHTAAGLLRALGLPVEPDGDRDATDTLMRTARAMDTPAESPLVAQRLRELHALCATAYQHPGSRITWA